MSRDERLFTIMRRWAGVQACLDRLTPFEKILMVEMFYTRDKTLAQKAKQYGKTKEGIRQKEASALKILRDMLIETPEETPA